MRRLWVAAALAPLTFAAQIAHAQTSVATSTTAPLATSTAGNVTVTSAGTIDISASTLPAAAVTIDSTNGAGTTVANAGSITYSATTGTPAPTGLVIGIKANAGFTGEITNTGSISISEKKTDGDTTLQGLTTGPFANGFNRYGIYIAGPFTGVVDTTNLPIGTTNVANSFNPTNLTAIYSTGAIAVIGENSAGIYVGGTLNGNIYESGNLTVTGGTAPGTNGSVTGVTPDVSYGIHSVGTINGNVYIGGSITTTGQNAVGVSLDQGDNGALTLGGVVTASGYRDITNPGLTIVPKLNADQFLKGGPGVYVGGNVTGGIQVVQAVAAVAAVPATSTTPAVPAVPAVPGGSVTSFGDAPALLIGGANPLTVSQVGTTGADLLVGGGVSGSGIYDDVNATAIQIGGKNNLPLAIGGVAANANFGSVTFANSAQTITSKNALDVVGTVSAATLSVTAGKGNATAVDIGAGASIPSMNVSGTVAANSQVEAGGAGASGSAGVTSVVALKIETGGALTSLTNSGTIVASITPIIVLQNKIAAYAGGTTGNTTAILDSAGSLTSITNTNVIAAEFVSSTATLTARGTALDLSANTAGVSVTQSPYVLPTGSTAVVTPSITGDIIFGSGSANLNVETGKINGNVIYGSGAGNMLTIGDISTATPTSATVSGALVQNGAGVLGVNVLDGALTMNAPTSTTLGGSSASLNLSSLHVGALGQITFTVNPTDAGATTTPQFLVAGTTALDNGSKINLELTSKISGTSTYTLIQNVNAAGDTLTATGVTTNLVGGIPFIYAPTLNIVSGQGGSLSITLATKTAAQLTGFSNAERAEYGQFFQAFSNDAGVTTDVLSKTSEGGFKRTYDQFLPDFAGGPFQTMELGQEAIYRAESEAPIKLETDQTRGWVQEIGYLDHQDNAASNGYNGSGIGVVAGVEAARGDGAVGITGAFITTKVKDAAQSADGHLTASLIEGGAYWRSGGTGLNFDASVNGGWAFFDSRRMLIDTSEPDPTTGSTTALVRTGTSNWSGGIVAAHVGVSAPFTTGRFYMRPEVSADYYALFEGGHSEHGGGVGFDLNVASRTSQEAIAQADMVFGATFGQVIHWRPELTLGWRDVVEGGPGTTTANFSAGSSFQLSPEFQDKGGFLARLGIRAGGQFADFSADAGAVYGNGAQNYDARALARFLF